MYQASTTLEFDPANEPHIPATRPASRRTRFVAGALLVLVAAAGSACSKEDDDPVVSSASAAEGSSTSAAAAPPVTSDTATAPAPAPAPSSAVDPGVDFVMPDLVGLDLQTAQNQVQTNGVFLSVSHDLLGSRNQVVDSNWMVCTQNIPAGQQVTGDVEGSIDFGVVKREERCP
ncbi:PASTA domain-containing protein [Blastococcus sp. URHD0036]|uniref:PASTA domain-containing protein n=1 Tax=Blastococcus sp. URHD0036 TaxID=1380356 RepID=UPI00068C9C13|nr:PASTA domain-containing protein [Blastococcus sp. URHD0036]